jgi:hypothetical protein
VDVYLSTDENEKQKLCKPRNAVNKTITKTSSTDEAPKIPGYGHNLRGREIQERGSATNP